jgi:hypothetical protein
LAHLARPAGLIYVALLIAFLAMPILPNWHRRPAPVRSLPPTASRECLLSVNSGSYAGSAMTRHYPRLIRVNSA